jgi:hypothetical protein
MVGTEEGKAEAQSTTIVLESEAVAGRALPDAGRIR